MPARSYAWAPFSMAIAASYVRDYWAGHSVSPLALALWLLMGWAASVGTARAVQLFGSDTTGTSPSLVVCTLAYATGATAWALLPEPWLTVMDRAGFVLMVAFSLGWLVGVGDLTMRVVQRAPTSTPPRS